MREKLLLFVLLLSTGLSAQYVKINTPVDCEKALRFSETAAWGALLTDNIWTGDVVIVDDGTALPTEGCSPLVNGADVTGKIAFIDRGSCNFSLKALNAQNAGAMAAIIANHTAGAGTIVMGAGNFATDVTIPVVMISYEDGQLIREKLANGVVNMSIGNLKFDLDLGVETGTVLFPGYSTIPGHQVETAGNITFIPGASVTNNGSTDGSNVFVEATITHDNGGGATEVYNEAGTVAAIQSDSSELIVLSDFDPSATGEGRYDFSYSVTSDVEDDVPFDNDFSASFNVSNNVYAKARWDEANNRPMRTNGFTIAGGGPIEMLTGFEFPNGTNLKVDSVIFHVSTNNASLANTAITVYLYNWDDVDGDGNYAEGEVEIAAFGFYEFDVTTTVTEQWITLEIEDFFSGDLGYVVPADGARLIVGTRYEGVDLVFFGFDEGVDLDQYINGVSGPNGTYNDAQLPYSQTTTFGPAGADFGSIGIFTDTWVCSSTALYVNPTTVSTNNLTDAEANVNIFPNPSAEVITVEVELSNLDNGRLVYSVVDMQGRTIFQTDKGGLSKDVQKFDVSNLSSGSYEMIIATDKGIKSVGFVVK